MALEVLRFNVVDVFTDRPFAGNQLAVVHGAGDLSTAQLLALAREFNFSETTFPSHLSPMGYSMRIFTPGGEIPFAGHPTLGTAWVLRRAGVLTGDSAVQTCGAGEIEVSFSTDLVSLRAVPRDLHSCPSDVAAALLADIGLSPDDQKGQAYAAGTGLSFVQLRVNDDAVARARPATRPLSSYAGLAALGTQDPLDGINLYAVSDLGERRLDVHSRVFVPGLSVPEDPATGSAATGLGLALVADRLLPVGGRYDITQGVEMGRPSRLHGSVDAVDGVATSVSVTGGVHHVASGEIVVPPG